MVRTGRLDQDSTKLLRALEVDSRIDFWKPARSGQSADILVPPGSLDSLTGWLAGHGISASVMVEDVERLIQETRPANSSRTVKEGSRYAMDWDDYHPHEDLNEFVTALADGNEWASIVNIGQSYEGRDMLVLAVEKAGPGAPSVWLEAGIHAREWVSPAVAAFIMRELVEDYAEHPEYIDKINW